MDKHRPSYEELEAELENIKKERDRFKHIADFATDWETLMEADGVFSYVSPSCLKITGYSNEEFMADPYLLKRIVHPFDYEIFDLHNSQIYSERLDIQTLTFRIINKNGQVRWIEHLCQPMFDENGLWKGQKASNRDITERRNAELDLQKNYDLIARLTEQVPGMIYQFLLKPDGSMCLPYVSKGIKEILELNAEDVLHDILPFSKRVHPDDINNILETIFDSAKTLQSWQQEFRVVLPRQGIRWRQGNSKPERLEDGSVIWHGFINDITDHKKAEQEINENEARLKLAIESAQEGTWDWNIETGQVTFGNYWAEMLGYSLDELEANVNTWTKLVHPDDMEEMMKVLTKHLKGLSESYRSEHRMKTKSGEWLWVLDHGKVIERMNNGQAVRAIGTHVNINALKKNQEELVLLTKQLKETNKTKDHFFSIIAHDMKGAFNSILGFAELLAKKSKYGDINAVLSYSDHIHKSAKSAYQLLVNLLEWANLQRGAFAFNPEKLKLKNVVEELDVLLSETARLKKVNIEYKFKSDIVIIADKNMLNSILRNLMMNAVKFTNPLGYVTLSAKAENDQVFISVADNGVGIEEPVLQQLFVLDSHISKVGTANEKGTGLGLVLCKEFVEKHGGRIWVESQINVGSQFSFSLPIVHD